MNKNNINLNWYFYSWLWRQWIKSINLYYFHSCIYFYYFYFLLFILLFFFWGWAGLNPAQHIYWWLGSAQPHRGWARPSQPGPVTGPSQWSAGQTADARVKHFHACINSAKVIKLPSHCSNAIWTQKQKQMEKGAPVSGDCTEGCNAGGVRLLSVSGDGEESCNAGVGSTAFCQ